ncbi:MULTISPECIES: PTS sugar transporter subunit IIA [Amycolatopsis]|uniref:Fructose PTS transporter subunit IIA n=1 Tax=Amycolatopsis tucumanensis TaxID=401106 RepID=A0ABP7IHI7_9PSEU|nr:MULTISPECIES: fructose PTS transporter subunit IIA [Amycolatopsis]MCF6425692.1 fructose PTS transporter subunit IIA [Amycolatopsis tucumanensis]
MAELITADLVDLDVPGADRAEVTAGLARRLVAAGRVTDLDGFLADIRKREEQMPTGIEGGIGIPHARSAFVTEPTLAFGRSAAGVDFGASDGPARLIFLIAAPEGGGEEHMTILAQLARRLVHQSFRQSLLDAPDADAVVQLVRQEVLGR